MLFSFSACKSCKNYGGHLTADTVQITFNPPCSSDEDSATSSHTGTPPSLDGSDQAEFEENHRAVTLEELMRERHERLQHEERERQMLAEEVRRCEQETLQLHQVDRTESSWRQKRCEVESPRIALLRPSDDIGDGSHDLDDLCRRCMLENEEEAIAYVGPCLEPQRNCKVDPPNQSLKQEQLQRWLCDGGFSGVNARKKRGGMLFSTFTYPLHTAVKAGDELAVRLLLWGGADKSLLDSARLTPLALALKLSKKGSHILVIDALKT